jgi:hypothetical protein
MHAHNKFLLISIHTCALHTGFNRERKTNFRKKYMEKGEKRDLA